MQHIAVLIKSFATRASAALIMTAKMLAVLVFCLVPSPCCLHAADHTLDLTRALALALEHDPRLAGMRHEGDATKEVLRQAWGAVLPVLAAEGVHTETTQNIISTDNQVFGSGKSDFPTTEYTLTLTQPVFNFASFKNIQRAREIVRSSELELEAARQDLAVRVAMAYFRVLAAGDRLEATEAEETAVSSHHELISERFNRGLSTRTEFYDAKARLAEVQATRLIAESDLDDAHQALKEIIGRPAGNLVPLRDELPLVPADPADAESWIDAAIQQNPSLEALRRTVEAARKEIQRQRAGHYPHVNLEANYNWRDTKGTLFGGGSEVETTNFLVRMNVPLYQGGIVSSRTREATHLMKASLQDEERLTRSLQREVRAAFFGVGNSIQRVQALAEAVEAQRLALEGKKEGHRSGLYTILAVLDGERDYSLARQNYAMARYDYIINSLILKQTVGTLGGDDIAAVNGWLKDSL
ncbi:MAG: TolC family outer membrane protein [Syntrophales bacterium]|jgi:outer membrane protein|nr:TolC family outer membrane protein [Syntrophales bacterium]MCK9528782.1 TolC family outer membrane protein [Syntrophales bacterium]MDX9922479.1 TolC family outer membrane protein [Syntrophales bacterium]